MGKGGTRARKHYKLKISDVLEFDLPLGSSPEHIDEKRYHLKFGRVRNSVDYSLLPIDLFSEFTISLWIFNFLVFLQMFNAWKDITAASHYNSLSPALPRSKLALSQTHAMNNKIHSTMANSENRARSERQIEFLKKYKNFSPKSQKQHDFEGRSQNTRKLSRRAGRRDDLLSTVYEEDEVVERDHNISPTSDNNQAKGLGQPFSFDIESESAAKIHSNKQSAEIKKQIVELMAQCEERINQIEGKYREKMNECEAYIAQIQYMKYAMIK
eukprot:jgi/Bigna1/75643/fgenesh1_pg.36_\